MSDSKPRSRPTKINRRRFLQSAALAPLTLSMLSPKPVAASPGPRARSVVLVWLWGGPSQLDTFDPKPLANENVRGPFHAIRTRTTGAQFTELLPRLADRSHRFAVIRGAVLHNEHNLLTLTGRIVPNSGFSTSGTAPHFGSIVAKHRRSASLPPFMLITPAGPNLGEVGFSKHVAGPLGPANDPVVVSCSANGRVELDGLRPLDANETRRLEIRRQLRTQLESAGHAPVASIGNFDGHWDRAYRMLTSPDAFQPFQLDRERDRERDAYGHTSFGQSLLLTRRLVEAGVPFVWTAFNRGVDGLMEANGCGWDTHYNQFEFMANWLCPVLDRGLSAFLDDLHQRGLLESTLVVVMGEMGRTPNINREGGREHWASGFSLWAGAGVQGGRIIGETDREAARAITSPVTSLMIGTTMAELAGVNAEARAEMGVLQGGSVIHDLF